MVISFDDGSQMSAPANDWKKPETDFFGVVDRLAIGLVGQASSRMFDAGLNFATKEGQLKYRESLSEVIVEFGLTSVEKRVLRGTGRLSLEG